MEIADSDVGVNPRSSTVPSIHAQLDKTLQEWHTKDRTLRQPGDNDRINDLGKLKTLKDFMSATGADRTLFDGITIPLEKTNEYNPANISLGNVVMT